MALRGPYDTTSTTDDPANLAERLRWLRKRLGLTRADVATSIGCDTVVVSNWELGRTQSSSVALGVLSKF